MPESFLSIPRITTKDVAKMCGVHEVTARRWVSQGRVSFTRLPGGRIRFTEAQAAAIAQTVPAKSA